MCDLIRWHISANIFGKNENGVVYVLIRRGMKSLQKIFSGAQKPPFLKWINVIATKVFFKLSGEFCTFIFAFQLFLVCNINFERTKPNYKRSFILFFLMVSYFFINLLTTLHRLKCISHINVTNRFANRISGQYCSIQY